MARSDSFVRKWASAPAQFDRPSNTLIERGWAGGAGEDPPEAKWENWWHNRADEALGEIEALGAMRWFGDVPYSELAEVSHGGIVYIAALSSQGIEPGSVADTGHWQRKRLGVQAVIHVTSSQAIPDSFEGLILIDAKSSNVTTALPPSDAEIGIRDVILRRTDGSANTLVVQASGTDTIMLDTAASPTGQASVSLLHRDDWLYLRSDGAGRWWVIGASMRATDTQRGITRYATKPEVRAGVVPDAAVTPESLSEIADFAIIYPNGGSAESPANVSNNSRYIMDNPFPGHHVICDAEIQFGGQWGSPGFGDHTSTGGTRLGSGVRAAQLDDSIVIQTGTNVLVYISGYSGSPFGGSPSAAVAPCRVKVWKVKGAIA